jgi:modulator of FtsH protease
MSTVITARSPAVALSTNKVIRNTYTLLSMTLLFSAAMAGLSLFLKVPHIVSLGTTIGSILLLWLVLPRTANSAAGIGVVFAITGLMGFGLGPILGSYLALAKGPQIVATAMGGTGAIFLGLSGYALTTRRDFNYLGAFLATGLLVVLGASLLNIFMAIPALSLAISAGVILLMSGFILYDTSRLVNGGETNYVMATVSLYLNIYNIFVSLLQLLGVFSSDD